VSKPVELVEGVITVMVGCPIARSEIGVPVTLVLEPRGDLVRRKVVAEEPFTTKIRAQIRR